MQEPNTLLTRAYGNEDVYQAKLAGEDYFEPLVMGLLNYGLGEHRQAVHAEQTRQAQMVNEEARRVEHEKFRPAEEALQYTPVPYSAMTRLASVADGIGRDMAKQAGIGDFANGIGKLLGGAQGAAKATGFLQKAGLTSGLKWKIPLALGALGAGSLAAKGFKSGLNYLSQEPQPAQWGTGPRLANGVNQYGQPQVGSSFQG